MDGSATIVRTEIVTGAQLRIELEQEALFSTFWASFHPLSLSHEIDLLAALGKDGYLWLLFDFDHLLSAIFREEDACIPSQMNLVGSKHLRTRIWIDINNGPLSIARRLIVRFVVDKICTLIVQRHLDERIQELPSSSPSSCSPASEPSS